VLGGPGLGLLLWLLSFWVSWFSPFSSVGSGAVLV
jgi:hypothetical protein